MTALNTALAGYSITVSEGPKGNKVGRRVPFEPRPRPMVRPAFKDRLGFIDRRRYRDAPSSPAATLADLLSGLLPHPEGWWSPCLWTVNRRGGAATWEMACGIVLNLDFADLAGRHVAPPQTLADQLGVLSLDLPGNLFHLTPRGAHLVFVLQQPVTDRALYLRAFEGACAATRDALERIGLGGREEAGGGFRGGYCIDRGGDPLAAWALLPNLTPPLLAGREWTGYRVALIREESCDPETLAGLARGQS